MTTAQAALLLLEGLIVIASLIGLAVLWMAARYEREEQKRRRASENVVRIAEYGRRRNHGEAA